jgi:hypothetical protein
MWHYQEGQKDQKQNHLMHAFSFHNKFSYP